MAQASSQTVPVDPYLASLSGVDPLYGQKVEDLTEHDRRQFEEYEARQNAQEYAVTEEELRKESLEHAAYTTSQQASVKTAAGDIKSPSLMFYGIWGILALIIDTIDIALGITGVWGLITSAILTIAAYLASNQIKKLHSRGELLDQHIAHVNQRISGYRQKYAKAMRTMRKTKVGRAVASRMTQGAKKVRKSPFGKALASLVANIVPILNLLPWQVYSVWTTYRSHQRAFSDGQSSIQEYTSLAAAEEDEFSQTQRDTMEELSA